MNLAMASVPMGRIAISRSGGGISCESCGAMASQGGAMLLRYYVPSNKGHWSEGYFAANA